MLTEIKNILNELKIYKKRFKNNNKFTQIYIKNKFEVKNK